MRGSMPFSTAVLDALSSVYGAAVKVRNLLYDRGVVKAHKVPPVVVSVGNIEAGGTGKTPFTMALARELSLRGHAVAILTRGYKGSLGGPLIVKTSHTSAEVGDEALLMARLSGIAVIKSPDRIKGALHARAHLGSTIIVLDDGFQHRRLHRDLDIVLVSRDVKREKLLPAGSLREHASALLRAHVVVNLKGAAHDGLRADLKPETLVDLKGNTEGLDLLSGKRALAFCAIGRPDHFFSMLEGLGARVERLAYPDHHCYCTHDMQEIMDRAAGKDLILTTEKDLVKIETAWLKGIEDRLYAVRAGIEMPHMKEIIDAIERLVQNSGLPGQG